MITAARIVLLVITFSALGVMIHENDKKSRKYLIARVIAIIALCVCFALGSVNPA